MVGICPFREGAVEIPSGTLLVSALVVVPKKFTYSGVISRTYIHFLFAMGCGFTRSPRLANLFGPRQVAAAGPPVGP